ALCTILLGNPRLRQTEVHRSEPQSRFKAWWNCVGSAIEHAAKCHCVRDAATTFSPVSKPPSCPPAAISFRDEFLSNEIEDEQSNALAIVLGLLRKKWPGTFTATHIIRWANTAGDHEAADFRAEFFDAVEAATGQTPPKGEYSSRALTHRLAALAGA